MASGSPLPTLDPLFLTPPHSVGKSQWDETEETEGMDSPWPLWRCRGSHPCLPWNYLSVCRTIFSGRRSPQWAVPMKGKGSFMESTPGTFSWDGVPWWKDKGIWRHVQFSSAQSLSRVRLLRPHELQHTRPPCPSPTPGVHSDSRPSSQ